MHTGLGCMHVTLLHKLILPWSANATEFCKVSALPHTTPCQKVDCQGRPTNRHIQDPVPCFLLREHTDNTKMQHSYYTPGGLSWVSSTSDRLGRHCVSCSLDKPHTLENNPEQQH